MLFKKHLMPYDAGDFMVKFYVVSQFYISFETVFKQRRGVDVESLVTVCHNMKSYVKFTCRGRVISLVMHLYHVSAI